MKTLRHLQITFVALALISFLAGCNTVQGVGKDMQAGGREIQKAAN